MIIDLPRGKRVSIFAAASPALVSAALKGLLRISEVLDTHFAKSRTSVSLSPGQFA
jgi:hypothetical protein